MVEERELVAQVIAGDTEAEERFFKLFRPRLVRASLYFLGYHDPDAEDVVQETFIVALPRLKNYDFRAPIYAWLRQICLRLCYARMRNRGRVLVSMEEDLEVFMLRTAMERIQNADQEALKQERLTILTELKGRLGAESKEIIELRNVQGLSYAQISLALEIPLGTVMSRLARARDQLRKMIEDPVDRSETEITSS